MRYCGHLLIKAEGGAKNYERDHPLPLSWRPFTVVFVHRKGYIYIYLITSILRNIASQLQCISASASGTSAIPVTDEQYFSVAL